MTITCTQMYYSNIQWLQSDYRAVFALFITCCLHVVSVVYISHHSVSIHRLSAYSTHINCIHSPIRHWNVCWSCVFLSSIFTHMNSSTFGSFYSISARSCRLTLYADHVYFILFYSLYVVIFIIYYKKKGDEKNEKKWAKCNEFCGCDVFRIV